MEWREVVFINSMVKHWINNFKDMSLQQQFGNLIESLFLKFAMVAKNSLELNSQFVFVL